MLDITKTSAFLHAKQNIVKENKHDKNIGANYTLKAKQGINNWHQALMGMIPEIMLDITKTGAFLHAIQNIVTENKQNKKLGANYTLKAKQGINNWHQALMGMIPEIMRDIIKLQYSCDQHKTLLREMNTTE